MNRRLVVTLVVGGAVIVTLLAVLVVGRGGSEERKVYLQPTSATGNADSATGTADRCTAVDAALPPDRRAQGTTMVDVVKAPIGSGPSDAAGSAFLLMDLSGAIDYGEWEPAVRFLEAAARHSVEGTGPAPKLTDDVTASAARIDRDLAAGVCR